MPAEAGHGNRLNQPSSPSVCGSQPPLQLSRTDRASRPAGTSPGRRSCRRRQRPSAPARAARWARSRSVPAAVAADGGAQPPCPPSPPAPRGRRAGWSSGAAEVLPWSRYMHAAAAVGWCRHGNPLQGNGTRPASAARTVARRCPGDVHATVPSAPAGLRQTTQRFSVGSVCAGSRSARGWRLRPPAATGRHHRDGSRRPRSVPRACALNSPGNRRRPADGPQPDAQRPARTFARAGLARARPATG